MSFAAFLLYLGIAVSILAAGARHHRFGNRALSVASGIAILMSIGQVLPIPSARYPIVPWIMYDNPEPSTSYVEVRAFYDDAHYEDFPVDDLLLWTPGPLRGYSTLGVITASLIRLQKRCACAANDRTIDAVLAALARIHTEISGRRIRRAEIVAVRIAMDDRLASTQKIYSWSGPASAR